MGVLAARQFTRPVTSKERRGRKTGAPQSLFELSSCHGFVTYLMDLQQTHAGHAGRRSSCSWLSLMKIFDVEDSAIYEVHLLPSKEGDHRGLLHR